MTNVVYPDKFWNDPTAWTAAVSAGGATLGVTFFAKAPVFETGDTYFGGDNGVPFVSADPTSTPPETLQDLLDSPFWQVPNTAPVVSTMTGDAILTDTGSNVWNVTLNTTTNPSGFEESFAEIDETFRAVTVAAAIWYNGTILSSVSDPLMALIRFDDELVVHSLSAGDGDFYHESGRPLYVQMSDWVVQYKNTTEPEPALGKFEVVTPYVSFESARETHISLVPERTNMVANPSFESGTDSGKFGWRSNGTMTVSTFPSPVPLGPNPRSKSMQVSGGTTLESVPFPIAVAQDPYWSVECGIAGSGTARIGLTAWEEHTGKAMYAASDEFTVNSAEFQIFRYLAVVPDLTGFAAFRVEFTGGDFYVDNVLVDNNAAQLGYFDGNWHMGMEGDFSWYGDVEHDSYSLFYNDRSNLDTMLFGFSERVHKDGIVNDLQMFTSAEINAMGIWTGSPPVVVNADMTIREAWDEFQQYSGAEPDVLEVTQQGGTVGYIPYPRLNMTKLVHQPGEAQNWVPEGARVIPHWDDVYRFESTSTEEELYVPVEDYTDKTVVAYVE